LLVAIACLKPTETAGPEQQDPRTIVMCIDRSGSYDFPVRAVAELKNLLPHVIQPGDTLYVRWIEENSYAPEAAAERVDGRTAVWQFPFVSPPPEPLEELADPKDKAEFQRRAEATFVETLAFNGAVAAAIGEVTQIAVPSEPAQMTDVYGCVTKSCELLRNPADIVWIASDLEDNVGRTIDCKLPQAQVVVSLFQCDIPCPEKRWSWASLLATHGAQSTTYLDPSLPVEEVAKRIREEARATQ
jgi:hypothetical protein